MADLTTPLHPRGLDSGSRCGIQGYSGSSPTPTSTFIPKVFHFSIQKNEGCPVMNLSLWDDVADYAAETPFVTTWAVLREVNSIFHRKSSFIQDSTCICVAAADSGDLDSILTFQSWSDCNVDIVFYRALLKSHIHILDHFVDQVKTHYMNRHFLSGVMSKCEVEVIQWYVNHFHHLPTIGGCLFDVAICEASPQVLFWLEATYPQYITESDRFCLLAIHHHIASQ